MAIKNKQRPCKICGKSTYGFKCDSCKTKEQIAKKKAKPIATKKPKVAKVRKPIVRKPKEKKPGKKKSPKVSVIKKHAFDVFSLRIRLRDSDMYGNVLCITCPRICFFYDDCMDCGHFQSRKHMATALHEFNNSGQCGNCNGRLQGMQYAHGKALDLRWGPGTADEMEALARTTKQFKFIDYLEIIKESVSLCDKYIASKVLDKDILDKLKVRLDFYRRYIVSKEKLI